MCIATYPEGRVESPPLELEAFSERSDVTIRRWVEPKTYAPGFDVTYQDGRTEQYQCIVCPK